MTDELTLAILAAFPPTNPNFEHAMRCHFQPSNPKSPEIERIEREGEA